MVFVALGSIAARAWLVLDRPLWFDELFTVWASRPPLSRLLAILANDSGPPLFYVLEMPLVAAGERIFFSDETARALPFTATLALFAGVFAIPSGPSRRRFALLAALSPLLTAYSGEARAYAVLALLVFLLYLVALARPERPRSFAVLFLLTAAALYTHYLALFAVTALAFVAVAGKRARSALAIAAGSVPFLPWVPVMARQPEDAVAWMRESPAAFVGGVLSSFGGAGRIASPFGPPLPPALTLLGGALGLALVVSVARSWRTDRELRGTLVFLAVFLGAVLFASLLRPVGFAGRTEMAVLPVWLWAVALAGERSGTTRLLTAGVLAVGAIATALLVAAPKTRPLPLYALARLETVARRGDVLFAGAHFYLPARLAADRRRLKAEVRAFPTEQAAHPGWSLPVPPRREDFAAVETALDRSPADGRVFFQLPPYAAAALGPVLSGRGSTRRIAGSPEMVLLVWRPR